MVVTVTRKAGITTMAGDGDGGASPTASSSAPSRGTTLLEELVDEKSVEIAKLKVKEKSLQR